MITAIIPAYNEEKTIGSVVLGTLEHVSKVIVVDDGSSDKTSQIARLAGAEVLVHPVNKGKGAALKTGFKAVEDAKIIVTLDSDGQHDSGLIPNSSNPSRMMRQIWLMAAVTFMVKMMTPLPTVGWDRMCWMQPPTSVGI